MLLSFSQQSRVPFANSRMGFKSIVAQKLARVVTSSTKNDGWRSFRLEYRDCYPTSSGNDLLLTSVRRQHYFSLNEWPSVAGADLRNAKLCGLYSHGRVITFPWPPYPSCPPPLFSSSIPFLNPSFRTRVTIPREPVIFIPKWPVSSNWTMITRTITTRIIATVMRKITAPEVISLIALVPVYNEEDDNTLN